MKKLNTYYEIYLYFYNIAKRKIFLGTVLFIFSGIIETITAALIGLSLSTISNNSLNSIFIYKYLSLFFLDPLIGLFIVTTVLISISFFINLFVLKYIRDVISEISTNSISGILESQFNLPFKELLSKTVGESVSLITNQANAVFNVLINNTLMILKSLFVLIFLVISIFLTSFTSGFVIIFTGLLLFRFVYFRNVVVSKKLGKEITLNNIKLNTKIQNLFKFSERIKANNFESKFFNISKTYIRNIYFRQNEVFYLSQFPRVTIEFVFFNLLILTLILINLPTVSNTDLFTELTIIGVFLIKILTSFQQVYANSTTFTSNIEAWNIISQIYPKEVEIEPQKTFFGEFKVLSLINIVHSFDGKLILNNFSYNFKNKGLYLITGDSGSGKTTLLRIISGLIVPESGIIKIDEKIHNANAKFQDLAYLPANTELFDLSIFDHFNLDTNNIPVEIMNKMLQDLNINLESINSNKKQEKEFSTGEIQRILISGELLRSKNIYIFDEPTSNLNLENIETVIFKLKELSQKKLVIISSHNSSIKNLADEIIEL